MNGAGVVNTQRFKRDWEQIPNALPAVGYDGGVWIASVVDCIKKVEHTNTWQQKHHYNAGEPKAPLFTRLGESNG